MKFSRIGTVTGIALVAFAPIYWWSANRLPNNAAQKKFAKIPLNDIVRVELVDFRANKSDYVVTIGDRTDIAKCLAALKNLHQKSSTYPEGSRDKITVVTSSSAGQHLEISQAVNFDHLQWQFDTDGTTLLNRLRSRKGTLRKN